MRRGPWEGGVYQGRAYGGRVFEEVGSMRRRGLWTGGLYGRRGHREAGSTGPMNELGFPRQTLDPSCNLTGLVLNSKIPLSHSFIYSRVPHPRAHGLVPPVK